MNSLISVIFSLYFPLFFTLSTFFLSNQRVSLFLPSRTHTLWLSMGGERPVSSLSHFNCSPLHTRAQSRKRSKKKCCFHSSRIERKAEFQNQTGRVKNKTSQKYRKRQIHNCSTIFNCFQLFSTIFD